MGNKVKSLFLGFIFLSITASVFSQDALYDVYEKIEKLTIKDVDQLIQLMQDKEIVPSAKARAINRVAVLYQHQAQEIEKQQNLITVLAGVIDQNKADSPSSPQYKVRSAACLALRIFDPSTHANAAIDAVKKPLLEDSHLDVLTACAHSLGDFNRNSIPATKALLERLSKDYTKENRSSEDVRTVSVVVNALGKLGSKQSFIPLMKVLQSGYPVSVKKEAQIAIDRLRW
ncbi:MAG: HEAT repeat domain-containing protein [Leptospiraceae bacterium]|nr:HEAT repeat domain-containing protein [Leptospiraceae bacterium]